MDYADVNDPLIKDAQKLLSGAPIENLKLTTGKLDARLKKLETEGKRPGKKTILIDINK